MSIKGFEVGGVQAKYDYESLDNIPANLVQDANYVHTDNNYTNADKTKLSGIEAQANKTTIDATLTQSGQAADAKATGDAISALNAQVIASMPHDTASGAIASFPDGAAMPVRDLSVAIEPVQSLNGYDNPWPAGGGANKYPESAISGTNNAVTVTQNGGSYSLSGTASAYTQFISTESFTLQAGTYTLKEFNWVASIYVQLRSLDGQSTYANTAGAESNTFTLASETTVKARIVVNANTVTNRTIQIEIVSGSTAPSVYTPYSNICPISGWTECKVTRTGRNLCNSAAFESGLLATAIGSDINAVISSTRYSHSGIMPAKSALSVTVKTLDLSKIDHASVVAYVGDKVAWTAAQSFSSSVLSKTWTIAANTYEKLCINIGAPSGVVADVANTEVQVELGSTATAYEPYQGTTYTIDLNGTRYGGTLDVTRGKLTVDRANIASYNGEPLPSTWISDRDVYAAGTNPTNGAEVVYKLATPIEVDLDPVTIETLLGTNNIFADCGDTTVSYYADTTLFVNKKIAAVVAALS